MLIMPMTSIN